MACTNCNECGESNVNCQWCSGHKDLMKDLHCNGVTTEKCQAWANDESVAGGNGACDDLDNIANCEINGIMNDVSCSEDEIYLNCNKRDEVFFQLFKNLAKRLRILFDMLSCIICGILARLKKDEECIDKIINELNKLSHDSEVTLVKTFFTGSRVMTKGQEWATGFDFTGYKFIQIACNIHSDDGTVFSNYIISQQRLLFEDYSGSIAAEEINQDGARSTFDTFSFSMDNINNVKIRFNYSNRRELWQDGHVEFDDWNDIQVLEVIGYKNVKIGGSTGISCD